MIDQSNTPSPVWFRWIRWPLWVLAAVLVLLGGYQVIMTWQWVQRSVITSGTVVRIAQSEYHHQDDSVECHRVLTEPIIQFTDTQGMIHEFAGGGTSKVYGFGCVTSSGKQESVPTISLPISHMPTIGSSRSVRYDPQNPSDGREDTFWGIWTLPIVLAGVGVIALMVGYLFTIRGTTQRQFDSLRGMLRK